MSTLGAFWRFKEMGVFLLFYNNVLKNTKFTFDGSSLLLILLTVKNVKSKIAIKHCFLSFQKIMFFLSFSSYFLLLFSLSQGRVGTLNRNPMHKPSNRLALSFLAMKALNTVS